jgi:ribonuclease P protein component
MKQTFHRSERLKSEKTITSLFKEGRSFSCYPLRLVWSESIVEPCSDEKYSTQLELFSPIQFALSVPKRNFKRAHDRNLLRRRVREAYRLNKHSLYEMLEKPPFEAHKNTQFAFMVLYTAKETLPYEEIERGIKKMIYKFGKESENSVK